ncbi:uncharacterized protein LOC134554984 isoform X2 [Prinia subflava]|uniref:uncharacterized protein LOC134554984 isoform X2 n=1 Tax=Prinia subflava TaxID=208062 RepID=UPI002FE182AA
MSLSVCHQRGCEAVPEADLRKAFSALLMSPEQGAVCSQQRDAGCELQESEFCSRHGVVKELLHLQEAPAAGVPHLPGVREATCHEQGDATCKRAGNEDVESGFCSRDGSVREPLRTHGRNVHRILRSFPGPALVVAASSSFLLQASGSGAVPCPCWCWLCSCCWCWLWRWPWLCSQPHSFQSHLQLRSWFWPVPLAGLATMGSATTSPGIPAPGSRVRNGAPSSGPPWPLSRMRTWVCSSASAGTSITGSGCADGASACTGGTAATSAPGFMSLAIPSVCTWLTINL